MAARILCLFTMQLLIVHCIPLVSSGRVLLYPYGHGYNTRLTDMLTMAQTLNDNSHQIGILINDIDQKHVVASLPDAVYHLFPSSEKRVSLMENEELQGTLINSDRSSTTNANNLVGLFQKYEAMCEMLLNRSGMLNELRESKYDVIILDIADNCGRIVSHALGIPIMPFSSTGLLFDQAYFPNLPSIVPHMLTSLTSNMTFWQRVTNSVISVVIDRILDYYFFTIFERLEERYGLNKKRTVDFRKGYADQLHLIHADFAIEEPRPLLPNIVFIGGMFVQPVEPLEKDLDDWMDGAGEPGVVIVSFGSNIKQIEEGKATVIATTLAKLKQRVIWRYDGEHPPSTGANTRLLKWLPQSDLLGHPQTRVFVTHCGIHGTYETAMHGVPVIAIPLMLDQHANAVKLTKRAEMGVLVDFQTLTVDAFSNALNEVLNDPKYALNAKETSRKLKDNLQKPKEVFLFWVDYVIRNKGIGKMVLEPLKRLGTFELYCIDVILFICCVVVSCLVVLLCSLRMCYRCLCRKGTKPVKSKTS